MWFQSLKKDGKVRIYVEYKDLNKTCLKNDFLLLNMDILIDSTCNHGMFSLMDGFSDYNQIKMAAKDDEKTAF